MINTERVYSTESESTFEGDVIWKPLKSIQAQTLMIGVPLHETITRA